jgi:4-coumarate--CoA ligase
MVFKSPYSLQVPNTDLLTYLFTSPIFTPNEKVWIDALNPSNYITQARAKELTQRIGAGLQSLDITRPTSSSSERDVILLISENQIMTPVTMFGIINAGGIVCTAATAASSYEIARQIGSCLPKLIIVSQAILQTAKEGVEKSVLKGLPIAVMDSSQGKQELKLVGGKTLISDDILEFENITSQSELEKRVIFLGYSSGTTGIPKGPVPHITRLIIGVQITHRNVVSQISQWEILFLPFHKKLKAQGLQTSLPGVLPLSFAGGITVHISMPLRIGLQTYMLPRFQLSQMLDVIQHFQLTAIFHSPPVFLLFTQPGFPREKIKSVRYAMSGAAPLSKGLQQRTSEVFYHGTKLATNWGMTEVVAVATMVPAGEERLDGSVGTLLPGMEGKVVDTITGKELGVGERGELLVKGTLLTYMTLKVRT